MSEYMFGVSTVRPTRAAAKKMNRVAEAEGAYLVEVTLPGEGYKRWFAGPNRGFPFDNALSNAVYAGLEAAGLTDPVNGQLIERHRARR